MCSTLYIRAETSEGRAHPGFPVPVEFDRYMTSDGDELCLCPLGSDGGDGEAARAALMEKLKPFLKAVPWGNIVIEVR